jgi:L-asparagine transporter-like permease
MIALGGTIGTGTSRLFTLPVLPPSFVLTSLPSAGLFVGAGSALATGGPLGIWLGYSIMGLVRFAVSPYFLLFRLLFLRTDLRAMASVCRSSVP